MSALGSIDPAGDSGGDSIKALLHTLVERIGVQNGALASPPPVERARQVAEAVYAARRARSHFLPRALLGEPAWDMLLDLFASDPDLKGLSTKRVCLAADVPYSTAWRCLAALEADGLITRFDDRRDARRSLVALTPKGETMVRRCMGPVSRHWTAAA